MNRNVLTIGISILSSNPFRQAYAVDSSEAISTFQGLPLCELFIAVGLLTFVKKF